MRPPPPPPPPTMEYNRVPNNASFQQNFIHGLWYCILADDGDGAPRAVFKMKRQVALLQNSKFKTKMFPFKQDGFVVSVFDITPRTEGLRSPDEPVSLPTWRGPPYPTGCQPTTWLILGGPTFYLSQTGDKRRREEGTAKRSLRLKKGTEKRCVLPLASKPQLPSWEVTHSWGAYLLLSLSPVELLAQSPTAYLPQRASTSTCSVSTPGSLPGALPHSTVDWPSKPTTPTHPQHHLARSGLSSH